MEKTLRNFFLVFITFFKISLFTFGGGYAMISLLQNELIRKKKWIEESEFMNVVAIAESTPGPIAINCATYIGYRKLGFFGAVVATLAVVIPSFAIIFAISLFFDKFLKIELVAKAFMGIKAAVAILILTAGIRMLKKIPKNPLNITLFVISFLALTLINIFAYNFSTIYIILIGVFIGIFVAAIVKYRNNKEDKNDLS